MNEDLTALKQAIEGMSADYESLLKSRGIDIQTLDAESQAEFEKWKQRQIELRNDYERILAKRGISPDAITQETHKRQPKKVTQKRDPKYAATVQDAINREVHYRQRMNALEPEDRPLSEAFRPTANQWEPGAKSAPIETYLKSATQPTQRIQAINRWIQDQLVPMLIHERSKLGY